MSLRKQIIVDELVSYDKNKKAIIVEVIKYLLFALSTVESKHYNDDAFVPKQLYKTEDLIHNVKLMDRDLILDCDDVSTTCGDESDELSDIDTEDMETLEVDFIEEDGKPSFTVADKWHNLLLRLCRKEVDEHRQRLKKILGRQAENQDQVFKVISKANLCVAYAIYDSLSSGELVKNTEQVTQLTNSDTIETNSNPVEVDEYKRIRFREVILEYISNGIEILTSHDLGLLYLGNIDLRNLDTIKDYTLQHYAYKVESALNFFGIESKAPVFPHWEEELERRFDKLPLDLGDKALHPFEVGRRFIAKGEMPKKVIARIKKILTATHPPLVLSLGKPKVYDDNSQDVRNGSGDLNTGSQLPPVQKPEVSGPGEGSGNTNRYRKGRRSRQGCPLQAANL